MNSFFPSGGLTIKRETIHSPKDSPKDNSFSKSRNIKPYISTKLVGIRIQNNIEKPKSDEWTRILLPSGQYNIPAVHDLVLRTISSNQKKIQELHNEIKKLQDILSLASQYEDTEDIEQKILDFEREVRKLDRSKVDAYIELTTHLLKEYQENYADIDSSFSKISSGIRDKIIKRDKIVQKYISVAREYASIPNSNYKAAKKQVCYCGGVNFDTGLDGYLVCELCHASVVVLDINPPFKERNRFPMNNKYSYSKEKHLDEAIKEVCGTQNKEIDPNILKNLRRLMKFQDFTKDSLTKKQLWDMMQEGKYSNNYDDLHLIHHQLTTKPCKDISMYREDIMSDHRIAEPAYEQLSNLDRRNSMNVYYKLLRLLVRRGYEPIKDDWCMLEDKISLYDPIWKRMCDLLNTSTSNNWTYEAIHWKIEKK